MTEIEIVGNPRSTYTRMVRMACEEKGVHYAFKEGLPHTPPVDAIHPFGKVPVMRARPSFKNTISPPLPKR